MVCSFRFRRNQGRTEFWGCLGPRLGYKGSWGRGFGLVLARIQVSGPRAQLFRWNFKGRLTAACPSRMAWASARPTLTDLGLKATRPRNVNVPKV